MYVPVPCRQRLAWCLEGLQLKRISQNRVRKVSESLARVCSVTGYLQTGELKNQHNNSCKRLRNPTTKKDNFSGPTFYMVPIHPLPFLKSEGRISFSKKAYWILIINKFLICYRHDVRAILKGQNIIAFFLTTHHCTIVYV